MKLILILLLNFPIMPFQVLIQDPNTNDKTFICKNYHVMCDMLIPAHFDDSNRVGIRVTEINDYTYYNCGEINKELFYASSIINNKLYNVNASPKCQEVKYNDEDIIILYPKTTEQPTNVPDMLQVGLSLIINKVSVRMMCKSEGETNLIDNTQPMDIESEQVIAANNIPVPTSWRHSLQAAKQWTFGCKHQNSSTRPKSVPVTIPPPEEAAENMTDRKKANSKGHRHKLHKITGGKFSTEVNPDDDPVKKS
jgi:hypothetical protein